MENNKSFQDWYTTEGIRTLPAKDKHWHESYCQIAYDAGARDSSAEIKKLRAELSLERRCNELLNSSFQTWRNKVEFYEAAINVITRIQKLNQ
jgi:hypothetical protein